MPSRPFYTTYAWAFDLLIDRPVRKECGAIVDWLIERGIRPGAGVLDAGCGTGRYAAELARRGYAVHGIDLSPELIDIARASSSGGAGAPSFAVGDIRTLPPAACDAILCRGVLNDLVDDDARGAVFASFAAALRPGGVLMLDVREWEPSAERKAREPLFRKRVATERGTLTFTSVTELDADRHQLLISERHELEKDDVRQTSDYSFVMRCWTRDELETMLSRHRFGDIAWFGAYGADIEPGRTDRLIAVARTELSAEFSTRLRTPPAARSTIGAEATECVERFISRL